ncbi:hypothetical protein EKD04_018610 [Chloroflexales bacterium ZM16-3]|nr:hypothetical protein [Chloroflexales bacterium ZM16-3]
MMRRLVSAILGMAILTVWVGVAGSSSALAQSAVITFESGVDGAEIGTAIPGVSFSNTAGNPWLYGDVRTGQYNAPFPDDCPSFGTQCAYAVDGNMFAWMGLVQGVGRIDFTSGGVTNVSAYFSTAETLTIEAYDSADTLVDSQQIAANLNTGRLDHVSLSGAEIAYVLITGAQNRWLMDDLSTDALYPAAPKASEPAQITVVQHSESADTITSGSSLTLTVVSTNRGHGKAKDAIITLPLDPALLRVEEATFSREGAWVSELTDTALTMQTGPLGSGGDVVTATIHLTLLDTAAVGGALGGPLSFIWRDAAGGGSSSSNSLALSVGGPAFAPSLAASAADGEITFSSAIFAPDEPVGLWYNAPDGSVVALDMILADAEGKIAVSLATGGIAAGDYSMVAYGHWTEFTAMAPFTVVAVSTGS